MEAVLDQTGPWHYPLLLINALGGFTYPWRVMALQFMAPKGQDYWCARPNTSMALEEWRAINEGVDLRCFVRDLDGPTNQSGTRCDVWEYDHSYYTRTLLEEWDAVCDREWQTSSSQSLMMAGMFGTIVFSHISDWYGRRICLIVALILSIISGFAVAASTTFWTFSGLRMVNSAMGVGFYTLALESVGTSKRALVSMSGDLGWFVGLVTFAGVTYLVRDWRIIQILIVAPDVFYLVCIIFMDESPKWLVSVGRFDEAKKLLKKIARRNGLQKVDVDQIIAEAREKIESEAHQTRGTLVDLFRGFTIARTTVACILNYMTVVFIYYHLMYFTVDLGDNPYFNLIFMALSEAPVSLTSFFVVKYIRRMPMYSITYTAIIASLIALVFLHESATGARMTFASIAKLSGQVTWSVLFVHISEVYPTHVRALMSGVTHTSSRVCAVVAPLLSILGENTYTWVPIAINISLCVIGWAFSFVLPETFGKNLPDTFHESKTLLRGKDYESRRKSKDAEAIEIADVRQA